MCLHRQCTQHPCSGKDPALKKDQKDKNRRTRICASSFTMDAVLLICRSGLLSRMLNIPGSKPLYFPNLVYPDDPQAQGKEQEEQPPYGRRNGNISYPISATAMSLTFVPVGPVLIRPSTASSA